MTRTTNAILDAHPTPPLLDRTVLAECVDACTECAQACTACADACLAEDVVTRLRTCIRLDLDCADVCDTTARVLSRFTDGGLPLLRALLHACVEASDTCRRECAEHAHLHEHCRICAEACRRCEEACLRLLDRA